MRVSYDYGRLNQRNMLFFAFFSIGFRKCACLSDSGSGLSTWFNIYSQHRRERLLLP